MPSFLHPHLFHRSHSFTSLHHLTKSRSDKNNNNSQANLGRSSSDMRKHRHSSITHAAAQPPSATSSAAPSISSALNANAGSTTSEKDKDLETVVARPKHKRIFSLTRQTPEPVTSHGSSDKDVPSRKSSKDADPPAMPSSLPLTPATTNSNATSSSAAPSTASHAPTLALLNGEAKPAPPHLHPQTQTQTHHKKPQSRPSSGIFVTATPTAAPTVNSTAASPAPPALSKSPSPESQPPSARSSTIFVNSPSLPANLAGVADDGKHKSAFRHMFRRSSRDHKDHKRHDRDTPSKTKHHHFLPNGHFLPHAHFLHHHAHHSGREAFSDGEDGAQMSPDSLDSIDYESAFRAVMLENIKLREEIIALRRRTKQLAAANGSQDSHELESYEIGEDGFVLGLTQESEGPQDLETSVRELTTAIQAIPGRVLIIVLIAGFVAIIRSWKDSCVYVV